MEPHDKRDTRPSAVTATQGRSNKRATGSKDAESADTDKATDECVSKRRGQGRPKGSSKGSSKTNPVVGALSQTTPTSLAPTSHSKRAIADTDNESTTEQNLPERKAQAKAKALDRTR